MEGNIIPFTGNLSDSVILEDIEHVLVPFDKILTQWKLKVMFSAAMLILLTNVFLIRLILRKLSRTFLDNLMILDSVSCICNMYSLFVMSNVIKLCNFSVPFIFTLNLFNRNVSFVTPLYRYVCVVHHELVDSVTKRKIFEKSLIAGITSITVGGAAGIVYFREKYFPYKGNSRNQSHFHLEITNILSCSNFLVCTGREQEFYYNDQDFTEESTKSSNYFDMSPLHPFRVIFNFIVIFGGSIGIPLLYGLTYKFTMNRNKIASGLSDEAKQRRRQRNLVSIRFNLMNWMLESVMIIMIFMTTDKMFQTTFILVTSIGTPLIYYLGIEENRKQIEEFYRNQIRKVKRPAAAISSDDVVGQELDTFDSHCQAARLKNNWTSCNKIYVRSLEETL